ncbi:MAG TPA: lasso RiPP family leader peptide-containing protein [Acidimicrobiales bacterium]|nr:lasso RiPP family leader peptide-containing protein [Acidimicrobiales bacterium]
MDTRRSEAGEPRTYEAPRLTVHGTLAEATQAFLIGPIIDNSMSQGKLIIGNTSL